jgi:ADP-ribose pyrophosphatase YjhB (NUDIX family)
MSKKKEKFASFGTCQTEVDKRFWCPSAGVCISVFVLIKEGDKVLLGKIAQPDVWIERWNLTPNIKIGIRLDVFKWTMPACHLKYGEYPDEAARRVLEEMLELSSYEIRFLECQSHLSEHGHWDICFVYEALVNQEIKTPAWFLQLAFKDPKELKPGDYGRGHGDVLSDYLVMRKS